MLRLRYSTAVFKFRLRYGLKVASYYYDLRRSHFFFEHKLVWSGLHIFYVRSLAALTVARDLQGFKF